MSVKRILIAAALLSASTAAPAFAEVNVISSGGFTSAYKELLPICEAKIGQKVASAYGASMGTSPNSVPNRLARGEPAMSSSWREMLSTRL